MVKNDAILTSKYPNQIEKYEKFGSFHWEYDDLKLFFTARYNYLPVVNFTQQFGVIFLQTSVMARLARQISVAIAARFDEPGV